jgi:hypothetical protein
MVNREFEIGDVVRVSEYSMSINWCSKYVDKHLFKICNLHTFSASVSVMNETKCWCSICRHSTIGEHIPYYDLILIRTKMEEDRKIKLESLLNE